MERIVRRRNDGQPLLTYISNKIQDFKVEDDFEKHREEVEKLLLGVKVRFTYKQRRPYKVVGVTSNNVREISVYHESKSISLVQYYKKKYDVDVVHHDLPGVILRVKRGRDKFVPFELCTGLHI